jgi:hypothetical protein
MESLTKRQEEKSQKKQGRAHPPSAAALHSAVNAPAYAWIQAPERLRACTMAVTAAGWRASQRGKRRRARRSQKELGRPTGRLRTSTPATSGMRNPNAGTSVPTRKRQAGHEEEEPTRPLHTRNLERLMTEKLSEPWPARNKVCSGEYGPASNHASATHPEPGEANDRKIV